MMPVAEYYVLNGHTLGFIYEVAPEWFNVLHGNPLLGGRDWKNGPTVISPLDELIPATLDDFMKFRVDPTGHINPDERK